MVINITLGREMLGRVAPGRGCIAGLVAVVCP